MSKFSLILMDHFQAPRNVGQMEAPDAVGEASLGGQAPRMKLYLRIRDGRVTRATFERSGCGVAIAACSLLTVIVTNRSIRDCQLLTVADLDAALGRIPPEKLCCARLALEALGSALDNYHGSDKASPASAATDDADESEL